MEGREVLAARLSRLALIKEQHADACRANDHRKAHALDDDVAALRAGAAALAEMPEAEPNASDGRAAVRAALMEVASFIALERAATPPSNRRSVLTVLARLQAVVERIGSESGEVR